MKNLSNILLEKLRINKDTNVSSIEYVKEIIKDIFSNTDPYMHYEDILDNHINEFFDNIKEKNPSFIIYVDKSSESWWLEKHKQYFDNIVEDYKMTLIWGDYFGEPDKYNKFSCGGKNKDEAPRFVINVNKVNTAICLYEAYKTHTKEIIIAIDK